MEAAVGTALEGGESTGLLEAEPGDVKETEVSLEKDGFLDNRGVELLGEAVGGAVFDLKKDGLVETVLDVGLEDTAGGEGFDLSKEGGESIGLETVCVDGGEEFDNFPCSEEGGDLFC